MKNLTVILRHGFENDHVRVSIDGVVAYERRGVRTRFQVDRADAFEVPAAETGNLDVRVEARGAGASKRIDLGRTKTIAVDLTEGAGIELHALDTEAMDA